MHIKLSIRKKEHRMYQHRNQVKIQNESKNTAMPLLKNHSRLYSSKVPHTVLCSYGTGEEQSCPLSQEKILT